jgi:hypothetical protein
MATREALIRDIGALIDSFVESAPNHRLFREAIDQHGPATSLVSCCASDVAYF